MTLYSCHVLLRKFLFNVQLPEEQAFALLVKIMNDYGLRDIFKHDFEQLHLKFFQLERMIEVSAVKPWRRHLP